MQLDRNAITKIANKYGLDAAAVLAVTEVESAGVLTWDVISNGVSKALPVIRWEGHYFYKLLTPTKRDQAVKAGLAAKKAGAVANPKSAQGRYDLLARAMRIDANAALSSISIGVGQVMGVHWRALGYPSAVAMFQRACDGIDGQVELMCRFITQSNSLTTALNNQKWAVFASGYNGPSYKINKYDTKLATAYTKFSSARVGLVDTKMVAPVGVAPSAAAGWLADVAALGYDTVNDFQSEHNLVPDGIIGPATIDAITKAKQDKEYKAAQPTKAVAKTSAQAAGGGLIAIASGAVVAGTEAKGAVGPIYDVVSTVGHYGPIIAGVLLAVVVAGSVAVFLINRNKTEAS